VSSGGGRGDSALLFVRAFTRNLLSPPPSPPAADAERRTDQATALRTQSSDADAASAQLEQNARKTAFLAADQKDQIKQLISVGKDQVTRAVQYNAHARKLRLQAKSLMSNALSHLKQSETDGKRYNINLNRYSKVVSRIHRLEAVGDGVITRLHEAGLKLAAVASRYIQASSAKTKNPKTIASLKKSLDAAQEAVAKLTQEQVGGTGLGAACDGVASHAHVTGAC